MCFVKTPKYRMYWEVTSCYEHAASVISKEQFEELKNIYFLRIAALHQLVMVRKIVCLKYIHYLSDCDRTI